MTSRLRRARKSHWGDCGPWHRIRPGDYYLQGVEFPDGDLGWANEAGHPVRLRECRECAVRYGRGGLFPGADSGAVATGVVAEGLPRPAEVSG